MGKPTARDINVLKKRIEALERLNDEGHALNAKLRAHIGKQERQIMRLMDVIKFDGKFYE